MRKELTITKGPKVWYAFAFINFLRKILKIPLSKSIKIWYKLITDNYLLISMITSNKLTEHYFNNIDTTLFRMGAVSKTTNNNKVLIASELLKNHSIIADVLVNIAMPHEFSTGQEVLVRNNGKEDWVKRIFECYNKTGKFPGCSYGVKKNERQPTVYFRFCKPDMGEDKETVFEDAVYKIPVEFWILGRKEIQV